MMLKRWFCQCLVAFWWDQKTFCILNRQLLSLGAEEGWKKKAAKKGKWNIYHVITKACDVFRKGKDPECDWNWRFHQEPLLVHQENPTKSSWMGENGKAFPLLQKSIAEKCSINPTFAKLLLKDLHCIILEIS